MAASLRLLVALILLTGGMVGLGAVPPGWLRSARQPGRIADYPQVAAPPAEIAIVARRMKAKAGVIEKLRAGELTLVEAAAWFRCLNDEPASLRGAFWTQFKGADRNEKLCRQVISWSWAETTTHASPSEAETMVCRLEAELARHLAEHGKVVLPGFDGE